MNADLFFGLCCGFVIGAFASAFGIALLLNMWKHERENNQNKQ